ncbi:uncharacterized protein RCC_00440 [Ramularia collo-cygni]|uniref:Apple domain-containing protein n=1 Tax=Ramularia collo-cygni TaxID=112498 RepID=A0A2D3ULC3_9PEZI|nr:uncharacterized protein RCC_00440 [Ramularia collo-cygni]CZT14462.1 uncharacterized protein RCC_00440 [Ramularia collo-cygni]
MQPSSLLLLASTYAISTSAIAITTTTSGYCTGTSSTGNSTIIPGTTCTAECSLDRPGGDFLPGQRVADLAACAAACNAEPNCLTASFVEATGYCYQKNFILNPVSKSDVDGVICRTCANGSTVPGTNCVEECGMDRPGSDIQAIQFEGADGLQRCAQACNGNPSCVTAQYRADNRFCYLKERANQAVADSNVNGVVCPKSSVQ